MLRSGWLLPLSLFFSGNLIGQRVENIVLRKYSQTEGLNNYNIRKILNDQYGFLWIASQDGLNRFDGINFSTYSKNAPAAKNRLIGIDIRDLAEDPENDCIWVLAGEGGLNKVDLHSGNVIKAVESPAINSEDWNICMTKTGHRLWIGSFRGLKVYNTATHTFEKIAFSPSNSNIEDYEVRSLYRDTRGNIWVFFTGYGIAIFNGSTRNLLKRIPNEQLHPTLPQYSSVKIFDNLALNDSTLLLATERGLRTVSFDPFYRCKIDATPCKDNPKLNTTNIRCLTRNKKATIFIGLNNALFQSNLALTHTTVLDEQTDNSDKNWLKNVNTLLVDNQDNLWLGCQFGLAYFRSHTSPFKRFYQNKDQTIKLDHVYSICPVSDQEVILACRGGLMSVNTIHNTYRVIDDKRSWLHVFRNAKQVLQACSNEGMFVLDNHILHPVERTYPFYGLLPFQCVTNNYVKLNDSLSCLATDNNEGILFIDYKNGHCTNVTRTTREPQLAADIVNMVYKDTRGRLVVLSDKVVTLLSGTHSQTLQLRNPFNQQSYSILFDICEAAGSYWFAAYGVGIIQADSNFKVMNVFSSRNGLSNDGVYRLFNIGDTSLIITTNNGLSVFDLAKQRFSNYFEGDGLHSNVFEESCGTTRNGLIYAGGVNGFTIVNPTHFSRNLSAPVLYFKNVSTQTATSILDSSNLSLLEISIPPSGLQTTIYFAGIDYANPRKVSYRYQIKELHKTMIPIGTQNFVSIIGFSPGKYHLQVEAANEEGIWSAPVELVLTLEPKWYQTWWFRILLATVVIGIVYGGYRMRIAQLSREESIRKKLATDLHDDLGSTLNSVKVYANLAMLEKNNETHLHRVKESIQDAIVSIRDMIWVLDDKKDTVDHLAGRILQFAEPLCDANGIVLEKEIGETAYNHHLGKEERRNLYMIVKETINNSIKYASCKKIGLTILEEAGKLRLMISDDGNGFELASATMGNGIRNVYTRAREAGYFARFTSTPGVGTIVELIAL